MPSYPIKQLEGIDHTVVPVVMGTEGVWDGSVGPMLYTAQDLAASVPTWGGRPVVLLHPSAGAGKPEVWSRQKIGTVFNAGFDRANKALFAEAWLRMDRVAELAPEVFEKIQRHENVEISTGLFQTQAGQPGIFRGTNFNAVAQNLGPDHLAILTGGRQGACSIAMGAGLCRTPGQPARVRSVMNSARRIRVPSTFFLRNRHGWNSLRGSGRAVLV
jgi:hypothetical protein